MVHNNIKGAKEAFLGGLHWNETVLEGSLGDGVVPTGRWVRSVGGGGGRSLSQSLSVGACPSHHCMRTDFLEEM